MMRPFIATLTLRGIMLAAGLCCSSALWSVPAVAQERLPQPQTPVVDEDRVRREDELFRTERPGDESDEEEEEDRFAAQRGEVPVGVTDRSALVGMGFVFGDTSASRRRSTALLIAIFPGLLLHGAGHLYLGEEETAVTLAMMEVGGLAMIGLGAAIPWVSSGRFAGSGAARPAIYTGVGLLLSSYVIDVVGVTRSNDPLIYASPLQRPGAALQLNYRFMDAASFPLRNIIDGVLTADVGSGFLMAETMQDVSLMTSRYGGELGWRPLRMADAEHQLFVVATGDFLQHRDVGRFQRAEVGLELGGVLDFGLLSPHLRRLYVGARGGYAYQWYGFPLPRAPERDVQSDDRTPLEWSQRGGVVPWRLFGGMSFTESLSLQIDYARHDGEFLHDVQRVFAVPSITATYRSAANLDLVARAEYGAGYALSLGLKLWMLDLKSSRDGKGAPASEP